MLRLPRYTFANLFEFFFHNSARNSLHVIYLYILKNVKIFNLVYFTTQVPDTSDTNTTPARHEQHKCDMNETRAPGVRHECYANNTSATQVKIFDIDNDTNENIFSIFSHSYVSSMANEGLRGDEKFHFKNYLFGMLVPMPKCV